MILYNITIVCWPYEKYMGFRIGYLHCVHRLQSIVYKVD